METIQTNTKPTKLKKVKEGFDKITSNHSRDWKLVIVWIVIFELISSIVEYLFVKHPNFSIGLPDTLFVELTVGLGLTLFIWGCVYTFIFWNKDRFLYLTLIGFIGLYLVVTHDMTFGFLLHNINPIHFFQVEFNFALFVELLFKLIILYLIYQLVVSYKNSKKE